jgi:pectinesterase
MSPSNKSRDATDILKANGRNSGSERGLYVINRSDVGAASGEKVNAQQYYLGRPWRASARVVFQNTHLSEVINPAGWSVWGAQDQRTSNVDFAEYGNTGPGASGQRANFAHKLEKPVGMNILEGESWIDRAYLS